MQLGKPQQPAQLKKPLTLPQMQQEQQQQQQQGCCSSTDTICHRKVSFCSLTPGALRRSGNGVILSPFFDAANLPAFPASPPPVGSARPCTAASSPAAVCSTPPALRSINCCPLQLAPAVREYTGPTVAACLGAAAPGTPQLSASSAVALQPKSGSLLGSGSSSGSRGSGSEEAVALLAAATAGAAAPEHHLAANVLPARLRELLIDPSMVEIMGGPQNTLGRGARWAAVARSGG